MPENLEGSVMSEIFVSFIALAQGRASSEVESAEFLVVRFHVLFVVSIVHGRQCLRVVEPVLGFGEDLVSRGDILGPVCQRSRYRLPHPRLAKYCDGTSSLIHYITGTRYSTIRVRYRISSTSYLYTIPVQVCPRHCSTG